MEFPIRNPSSPNPNPSDLHSRVLSKSQDFEETKENDRPLSNGFAWRSQDPERKAKKNFMSPTLSSITKKKIMFESNGTHLSNSLDSHIKGTPNLDAPSRISGARATENQGSPYDPVTNYLSPRPEFLRYNPRRRLELLQRLEVSSDLNEPSSDESLSGSSASSLKKFQCVEDSSNVEDDEVGGKEDKPFYSSTVLKLLLLLVVLVFSVVYISSMNLAALHENHLNIQDRIPPRAGNSSMIIGDTLQPMMLLRESSLVLNLIKSVVGDEGIDSKPLEESIETVELEGDESQDGFSLGDSRIGVEVNEMGLVIKDEVELMTERDADMVVLNGNLICSDFVTQLKDDRSSEEEVNDGSELVVERVEDLLVLDGSSSAHDLVASENNEEAVESREFLVDEQYIEAALDEGHKNEVCVMETGSLGIYSPSYQNSELHLSFLGVTTSSREETQGTLGAEITEPSLVPQSHTVSGTPSEDEVIEEANEFSTVADSELNWVGANFSLSKYVCICSSIIMLGLFSVRYKFFMKSHQSPPPVSPPYCQSAIEKERNLEAPTKEESADKFSKLMPSNISSDIHRDFYTSQSPAIELLSKSLAASDEQLKAVNDEQEELYAYHPPTVELLGELLVVESTDLESSARKFDRKEVEDSPVLRSQMSSQSKTRRSTRKNLSPSSHYVFPLVGSSFSDAGFIVQEEESLRKEDIAKVGDGVKTVTTPLRRSGRLKSRVTSP